MRCILRGNMKIRPKCIVGGRDPAFTIDGYFLPCCWVDNDDAKKFFQLHGFYEDHFSIYNLKTPEDIKNVFKSPEWLEFYELLENGPELAPWACKHHCGVTENSIGSTVKYTEDGMDVGTDRIRLLDVLYD